MNQYGYIRVSTKEQHIDRQLAALQPYNIPKKIFTAIINLEKILSVRLIKR